MNLEQAEQIATQFQELIAAIPREQIGLPYKSYPTQNWTHHDMNDLTLEDGCIKITWTRYSCGEAEHDTTYEPLSKFFN